MSEQPPVGGPRQDEDVRELLGAYALDAVDELERRAVERLVARDPKAARELAELRAVAAELGATHASPPPAQVRAAVLAEIRRTPQVAASGTGSTSAASSGTAEPGATAATTRRRGTSSTTPGRRPAARLVLAAAAAAVVAVGVPATVAWQQHERAVRAEARTEVAETVASLFADPRTEVVRGEVAGGGAAVALLGPDRAALVVDDLPAVAADEVYQLWAMREGTPVPAGLVDAGDSDARLIARDYRAGDGLALSVEPAGGSEQPTTEPVVVLLPG